MIPKIAVRGLHHEYVNRFTRERVVALDGVDRRSRVASEPGFETTKEKVLALVREEVRGAERP